MGVVAAKAAMERARISRSRWKKQFSQTQRQAGGGPNPARQISIRSGVPQDVPAYTVNKACASESKVSRWLQEIAMAIWIAFRGGTESMSRVPFYLDGRAGISHGPQELVDGMYRDGFFCPMAKMVMAKRLELLAEQYKISREEQDQFALCSHACLGRRNRADGSMRKLSGYD